MPINSPTSTISAATFLNTHAIAFELATYLQEFPVAEALYIQQHSWGYRCWIIVNHSSQDDRFGIYDKEWQLMESHTDIRLEFYVEERDDLPLKDIVTFDDYDVFIRLDPAFQPQ